MPVVIARPARLGPTPLPGQQPPVQDPDPFAPPAPVDDPATPHLPRRDPSDEPPVQEPPTQP